MSRILLASTMVVGLGVVAASAAPALQEGRSTYLHHHHHASHHYHMIHRHHHRLPGHNIDGENGRTTATGGNPGGYSTRN